LEAWDYVVRAIALMMEFSEQASGEAMLLLQKGISRDPTYARTYGHKAWLAIWRAFQGCGSMDAARFSEKASLPRPGHVTPHWLLVASYGQFGQLEKKREALFRLRSNVPGFLLTPENIHRFMYRMKTIIEYLMVWIGPRAGRVMGRGMPYLNCTRSAKGEWRA
jgi:hypothetical protein